MIRIKKLRLALFGLLMCLPFFSGCIEPIGPLDPIQPPFLKVSTTALNFSLIDVGTQKFLRLTLINQGERTLQVSDVKITNSPLFIFGIEGETRFNIHPNSEHELNIWFWPSESVRYEGSLKIYSDTVEPSNGPVLVELIGEAEDICGECNSPPDSVCLPSGNLLYYSPDGNCENGSCRYTALVEPCEDYCEVNLLEPACINDSDAGTGQGVSPIIDSGPGPTITDTLDAGMIDIATDAGQDENCTDDDADGHCNATDNCPIVYNPQQTDTDNDAVGDQCDNCPGTGNPSQDDADDDGAGDLCDLCPNFDDATDADADGRPDRIDCDNCLDDSNSDQTDADGDGLGDVCDNCPSVSNVSQTDSDSDRIGDQCDNCFAVVNEDQANADGDLYGDICDLCPAVPQGEGVDTDDDGIDDQCHTGTCFAGMVHWPAPPIMMASERFDRYEAVADSEPNDSVDDSQWVVHDLDTGLIWRGCPYGRSGVSCNDGTSQQVTYGTHLTWAGLPYAGQNDWRVPSLQELTSLLDYNYISNLDTSSIFPAMNSTFWTSTVHPWDTTELYAVRFINGTNNVGNVETTDSTSSHAKGLYVRGGNSEERCLSVEESDDTVTDLAMGLTWQRGAWNYGWNADGQMDWLYETWEGTNTPYYYPNMNNPCSKSFAGLTDWRLPNIYELQSLIHFPADSDFETPSWPISVFHPWGDTNAPYFWSSSKLGLSASDANDYWVINFPEGLTEVFDGDAYSALIRCVRDL
jgi:hypothetical protein